MTGTQRVPHRQGKDHSWAAGGCRDDSWPLSSLQVLVPPFPFQSSTVSSVGLQTSAWATPTHCTQWRSLRTPELLINRELQTLLCFRQTQGRLGEEDHTSRAHQELSPVAEGPCTARSWLGLVRLGLLRDEPPLGAVEVCKAEKGVGKCLQPVRSSRAGRGRCPQGRCQESARVGSASEPPSQSHVSLERRACRSPSPHFQP